MSAALALVPSEHPLGLPTGIHPGITPERYHARHLGLVNKGALAAIGRSPKHYRSWLEEPDTDTPAFAFGRAFHCAVLEPEIFARDYVAAPEFGDCRYREAKAARDEWRRANSDKIELSAADAVTIERMTASVRGHELGALLLAAGESELTIVWRDEDTGLYCKARPDYYVRGHRLCVDLKTTEDARLSAFTRDAVRYDYPLQDALYRAAFAAVGESVDHFLFLAVEKAPPFDVSVCTLDVDGVSRGYSRCRMRMDLMASCLSSDAWPGYEPRIRTIELPPYY